MKSERDREKVKKNPLELYKYNNDSFPNSWWVYFRIIAKKIFFVHKYYLWKGK